MDRQLWEGEANALLVEGGVDALVEVPVHRPEIARGDPGPDEDIDRAAIELMQDDDRLGARKDTFVPLEEALDEATHTRHILIVLDADGPLGAA